MFDRRLGRFDIAIDIIGDHPGIVHQVMADVIVVHAETLYAYKTIRYYGIRADFEEVSEGQEVPFYDIEIEGDVVTWVRRGE